MGHTSGPTARGLILVTAMLLLAACARHSENVARGKQSYYRPDQAIDCATVDGQIAWLEEQRPGAARRTLSTVRLILPPAWIVGAILGTNEQRIKVATGKRDEEIDRQIAFLRERCASG